MKLIDPPAQASRELTSFNQLADRYDGVLCDIWGVVHSGVCAFQDAVDSLQRYRAGGGRVVLVTNAPRASREIHPQLLRFGVPRDAYDAIVTSGDVTSRLIADRADAPLFHFGPSRDLSILETLTNPVVGPYDAELCLLTGPLDDSIETVDVYDKILVALRDRGVEMICANPDLVVRSADRMVICAGSIAQRYSRIGGTVVFAGKPEAAIYDEALRQMADITGRAIPKRRWLAIGDGLPTDIKGSADNGFDAYFVTGGLHSDDWGDMRIAANVENVHTIIENRYPAIRLVGVCERLHWA